MRVSYSWSLLTLLLALAPAGSALAITSATVTFQEGTGGYGDAFDRGIGPIDADGIDQSLDGSTVDTDTASFFLDADDATDPPDNDRRDYLVRFDNILGASGIPAGAVILDATLDIRTTSSVVNANSQTGGAYNVYRLTKPFDGTSTLAGDFGGSVPGVEPADGDADLILGSYDGGQVDTVLGASVTRAVQSWVNGDTNHGLAISSDRSTDGWSIHTTGSATPSSRPQLSVTYTTDPNAAVSEFQQGLEGYSGTSDVLLSGDPLAASIDGSTVQEVFLDGSNGTDSFDNPYMLKFDNLFGGDLPLGREIVKAELILVSGFASGSADSGGPFTVHQLLSPFSTLSTYADFAGDVNAMLGAGQIGGSVASLEGIDDTEVIAVDVTNIVQNWSNGATNHGFYVGANGTSNGWQIFTSGAGDSNFRPLLRIVSVPEPSSMALLVFALVAMAAPWKGRRV